MKMKQFFKNYGFITSMLLGIGAGCVFGWLWPEYAANLSWLGTIFTNLMFCVVVPMVFCSICSAIANMESMKKAGKIMGVTVATFCVTAGIAALIMYVICRVFPLVQGQYQVVEGLAIYPREIFCPVDFDTKKLRKTRKTVTIHWFSGSWHTEEELEAMRQEKLQLRREKMSNLRVALGSRLLGEAGYEKLKSILKRR